MSRQIVVAGGLVAVVLLGAPRQARATEDELTLDLGGASLELRAIPKGKFVQGTAANEPFHEADEIQRAVTISRPFWFGKVPVTRGQFARFVAETRHVTDAEKGQSGGFGWDAKASTLTQKKEFNWRNPGFVQHDDDPVVLVTFGDANAFVGWASRKTSRRVRLPTEAEWEYAARAGTTTPWYGASKEDEAQPLGWFKPNSLMTTHPVGVKKPNAFGLFDMSGNVFEWCRDVYAPYPSGDAVDPENTTNTSNEPERRVLRGGSWLRDPKRGRSAARSRNTPGSRNADNGFRVAVDDDPTPATSLGAAGAASGELPPASSIGSGRALGADAAASAAPLAPSRPTEGVSWTLIAAPAAAAGAAVAWVLARRRRRGAASASAADARGIGTRPQDDGFWIRARGLVQGTRVRYACIVGGVEVSDVVPLDGGDETFVYTGSRPSAIRIIEVVAAPAASYRSAQPSSVTGPTAPAVPPAVDPDADPNQPPSMSSLVIPLEPSIVRSSRLSSASLSPSPPPPPPSAGTPPSPRQLIPPPTDDPFDGYPRAY